MTMVWTANGWIPEALHDPNLCVCGSNRGREIVNVNGVKSKCSACVRSRRNEAPIVFRSVPRYIGKDVAARYIRRFGGWAFSLKTPKNRRERYLRDQAGEVVALITVFDSYPKRSTGNVEG